MTIRGEVYEFGDFTLDASERQLTRAGDVVALSPKAHDLLLALVRRAGHLVTKQELLDLVWPDAEVHRRELTIRASRNATREDFDHVMDSIRRGLVPTDQLRTHTMSFDQVVTELPRLTHEREGLIKAIISL